MYKVVWNSYIQILKDKNFLYFLIMGYISIQICYKCIQ